MTVRDVRTGDVHEVRERAGSRQVKVGELYCARVVPAGDTMQIFGGIEPVAIGERDALIALLDERAGSRRAGRVPVPPVRPAGAAEHRGGVDGDVRGERCGSPTPPR